MRVKFLGAARTVTGSRYLVETKSTRILVDCGLFQGPRELRERNREPLPFDLADLDAIVLTHAHLDHSGYLPVVVRDGFRGPVISTTGTRDLCDILLPDSAHLQAEAARYSNRRGRRRSPLVPLYNQDDVDAAMQRFKSVPFGVTSRVGEIEFTFTPAGHILGAASVRISDSRTSIVFSGDIGRDGDALMFPPAPFERPEYLVMESTYGDRRRTEQDAEALVADAVNRVVERGGVLLIPAFAVGRTQALLHVLGRLREQGKIPEVPMYLNSPMAIDTTRLYCAHHAEHRLSADECHLMSHMAKYVNSVEESRTLNQLDHPAVILSASGMATGGRILHHLKAYLSDAKNAVLFAGFQALGTRGRALVDGATQVRIHGEEIPVRAEILYTDTLSAHADADELVAWAARIDPAPRTTFLTHGEPDASNALAQRLRDELGYEVEVPEMGQQVELSSGPAQS
jgi:metallo-beta-lactamase family protein